MGSPVKLNEEQNPSDLTFGEEGNQEDMNNLNAMGMDQQKTPEEIGKIFELKKIYSRLWRI